MQTFFGPVSPWNPKAKLEEDDEECLRLACEQSPISPPHYTRMPLLYFLPLLTFPTRLLFRSSRLALATFLVFSLLFSHVVGELQAYSDSREDMQVPLHDAVKQTPVVYATSHNDEMQKVPFSLALSLGIACIEVDVWIQHGTLLAGHELQDLSNTKTLESLYLKPLEQILTRGNNSATGNWQGVFPRAAKQDLTLMIDVKGDDVAANAAYEKLLELLQPFIRNDWLTVYTKEGGLRKGPITVIGTGNTPLARVVHAHPRYVFYDAPLVSLTSPVRVPAPPRPSSSESGSNSSSAFIDVQWGPHISPMASSKWLWTSYLIPSAAALRRYSDEAHARGIACRWWGVLRWPAYVRRSMWELQVRADVDWLNADDLVDVAAFLRAKERTKIVTS